jgi:sarcosine oxidase subunit alpha
VRIRSHPIIDFKKRKELPFCFQKKTVIGEEGDTIASALHAVGVRTLTTSLKYDSPRGFFCGIGKCSSCLMRVNGVPNVRTCIAPLKEGITVEMQDKLALLPDAEFYGEPKKTLHVDVLVVGAGPAGLSAAIESANHGASVLIIDENQCVGGQLIKQTHKFFGSKQERAGTRGITKATTSIVLVSCSVASIKAGCMTFRVRQQFLLVVLWKICYCFLAMIFPGCMELVQFRPS